MNDQKLKDWRERAGRKNAIIPYFFEVFTTHVIVYCGSCRHRFQRPLLTNQNEPVFVCPQCRARNWVPVTYDLK